MTTGLFFGSFNPIHNGHLAIARYLLDKKYCDEIWFIVSPRNPWKKDQNLLPEEQRLEIVQTAVAADWRIQACDIEFSLPKPSYTYLTLRTLQQKYTDKCFALIMGGDNLEGFHRWVNYEEIVASYRILVYPRPGIPLPAVPEGKITVVNAPVMSISSTEIREKVRKGEDVSREVPESVLPLIQKYYHVDKVF